LDDDGVGDVWDEAVRRGKTRVPVRDGFGEREREFVGVEDAVGEEPEVVVGGGFVGGVALCVPVDGDENSERARGAEVEPKHAVCGAEAGNAAVDGDVTVALGGDDAVVGKKERDDGGKRRVCGVRTPQRLWLRELAREHGLETGVEAEVDGATVGLGLGEGPEPLEVVVSGDEAVVGGIAWRWGDKLVGVGDLRVQRRGSGESYGGELEESAHE